MIARYNNISLALGVPGLALQVVGNVLWQQNRANPYAGIGFTVAGTVLLIAGLAFYAKAKGRSEVWCLMGFLSIIGFIVLGCLEDLTTRRRRRSDDDDDDDDRPRRRRPRDDEDDDDRPRRRRRDETYGEDEDDRPRRRRDQEDLPTARPLDDEPPRRRPPDDRVRRRREED